MVGIPGFGWMAGLVEWRLVSDLAGCMICRWIGRYQCLICFRVGGVLLMVRRGDGGGGCLCGRRRCWGTERYSFRMWFCRFIRMTDGCGLWNHLMFSLLKVLIMPLLLNLQLNYRWLFPLCGIKMFLWRCSLLGGCSGTGYLRRTIFIAVVFWIKPPCFVCQAVGWRKLQIICFYIVIFLGQFGISLIGGLAHPRLPRFICQTISINSVLVVISPRCAARFYRLYGLLRCGKSGRNEITGSSTIKYARLFRWLKRLRFLPIRGWRWNLLHFPSTTMVGGLVRSPSWA